MSSIDERDPSAYVRSVLAPAAVAAKVREHYGLEVTDCALLRSLVNEVYAVSTSTGRYAFKLYRQENAPGARTLDEVGWEQQLVVTLAAAGVSVPAPVPRLDGSLVGAHPAPEGLRLFALIRWAEGSKPAPPFSDAARTAIALPAPVAQRFVPSRGSTAMSTANPPLPTFSPMNSIGASSRSPSPMTMVPSMSTVSMSLRMASTATWSEYLRSP